MRLVTILANANDNLSAIAPKIEAAVLRAKNFASEKFKIDYDINFVFAELNHFLIPEDGVGGRTYRADFVLITLDIKKNPSEDILFEIICHELCHAARWGVNSEYMATLFDGIINEGIATVFEEVAARGNKERQVFLDTVVGRSDDENKELLKVLGSKFDSLDYNYDEIFFGGNDKLPRWAGYCAGYYLVKRYLSVTGKTIEQAFADRYADFRIVLG